MTEGPFIQPGPGPARGNLRLLGLWILPLGLTWAPFWQAAGRGDPSGLFALLWVLAGSLAGAALGAPAGQRRLAVTDLDWLVTAALGFWMLSPPLGGAPGLLFSLAGGLAGGFISVRPGLARLRAAPGLAALALIPAAALVVEAGVRLRPDLLAWPLELIWGRPTWPFVFAAFAAGLAWNSKRPSSFLWPWLAAGVLFLAGRIAGLNVSWLPYFDLYRLAALTLPLGLIIPALARTKRQMVQAALIGLVFLWLPLPSTGLFALDRSLPPVAAVLAAVLWLTFSRTRAPSANLPEETSTARARLTCQGRSPLIAVWLGPPSCRLAAAHDHGPRRCPYGCLGLGDCRAACPSGAIDRDDEGFPRPRTELCRGCGRCRAACPKGLWELAEGGALIPCVARDDPKTNAGLCPVSCLGCGRCRKACPAGAIAGRAGASWVDPAICLAQGEACGRACAVACPRNLIL